MKSYKTLYLLISLATLLIHSDQSQGQDPPTVDVDRIQSQFQNGPNAGLSVKPASLTTPAYAMSRPSVPTLDSQIRINARFLSVDEETREAIYASLADTEVKTNFQKIQSGEQQHPLASAGSDRQSSRSVTATACVSTCLLSEARTQELLALAARSPRTSTKSPSVILIDGQEGQLKDIVQRPFVVGMRVKSKPATNTADTSSPMIQVLDEGTQLRVRASRVDPQTFHIASELRYMKVLTFETMRVFGTGFEDSAIQVPQHQVETASAAENIAPGQSLLIDPYVSRTIQVEEERGVPVFNKIPYMNKAFTNTAMAEHKVHMMVLLQPMNVER